MAKERPDNYLPPAVSYGALVLIVAFVFWLLFGGPTSLRDLGVKEATKAPPKVEQAAPQVPKPNPAIIARSKSEVRRMEWYMEGALMLIDISISNGSDFDIKDVQLRCEMRGASGTTIDVARQTIYDIVRAGETRDFTGLDLGFAHPQVDRVSCRIYDLEVN